MTLTRDPCDPFTFVDPFDHMTHDPLSALPQRPNLAFLQPVTIREGMSEISESIFRRINYQVYSASNAGFTFLICCSVLNPGCVKGDWGRKSSLIMPPAVKLWENGRDVQACRGYGYPWIYPWIYPCVDIRLGSCCGYIHGYLISVFYC